MSRCVIVSAAPFRNPAILAGYLLEGDYVIAADGGWQLALQMGVTPSMLVADFDSLGIPSIPDGVELITLPTEKDVTDTAEAMRLAYEAGYRSFLLLGCTGGRLDHQQATLAVAADYAQRGCEVMLADEQNEIHLLTPGSYVYPACPDEKVSLFAFGGELTGLFVEGLKYPIADYTLSPFDALCVSNEWAEEDASISFQSGLLMLYFSKD